MAIHTLTLGMMPLKKREYKHIQSRLYQLSSLDSVPLKNGRLPDKIYIKSFPGVTLKMIHKPVRRLELKLNPARMFGGSYIDLCDLSETALEQLELSINSFLDTIDADFSFSDMCLSRIDCTQDILLPETLETTQLIGAIQRSKLGRGYERENFSKEYKNYSAMNRHSFRARCTDIALTVYDKGFQLAEEGILPQDEVPTNRLRFEVAFNRPAFRRVMNEHLDATYTDLTTGKTIMFFSKFSIKLLKKYFSIGVMPGRFLRLDLAKDEIDKSPFSVKIKNRMKKFMCEVQKEYKLGVDGVLLDDKFSKGETEYLLHCFQELNLNPAALPTRCKCRQCPSIQDLLG